MRDRTIACVLAVVACVFGPWVSTTHAAPHPMDPLSETEINRAVEILIRSGNVQTDARMHYMRLHEMDKADVLAWEPGASITRTAETFIRQPNGFYRAQISLDDDRVTSWTPVTTGQAPLTGGDSDLAIGLIQNHSEWQEAIRKRGITDPSKVINITFSVGYFGDPKEKTQRLNRVTSYYPIDTPNFWGRPIGGLSALLDLDAKKVIEVIDTGVVPLPAGKVEYSNAAVGVQSDPVNPVTLSQPRGGSYTIDDHLLRWQNWEMHYRIDPQIGLILSNITFNDRGTKRPVLYQAAMSEMFVPYMDPTPGWYSRTFIDAGEYGLGFSLTPVIRGVECPENATLIGTTMAVINGTPQVFPDVLAVFERFVGDPAWRHADPITRSLETRRSQELVLRTIATVGNYDYLFDYVFCQDGTIHIKVGASGIVATKAVANRSAADSASGEGDRYGRFVDQYTIAVNHDHFIMYRLDFDVDGTSNNFVKNALRKVNYPPENPRRSGWEVDTLTARTEDDVKLRVSVEKPALWRIRSADRKNANDYPTSFAIHPGLSHVSLLSDDDWPQRRAAFSKYTLWMTPYDRDEYFAAGPFPNQSDGAGGIADWVKANRPIHNTDVVAWFSLGFHHVVRAEDWPIMPLLWHGFTIMPFDFFDRNPVLDLPSGSQ